MLSHSAFVVFSKRSLQTDSEVGRRGQSVPYELVCPTKVSERRSVHVEGGTCLTLFLKREGVNFELPSPLFT